MLNIDIANTPIILTGNPKEIRINCPECADTKYHMYLNLEKRLYICHRCECKGKLQTEYNPDVIEYSNYLSKNVNINIDLKQAELATAKKFVKSLPLCSKMVEDGNYSAHAGCRYLLIRGVTWEEIRKYDIRLSVEQLGPYKNTVIFPIGDEHNLKYFVCRKWDKTEPKYINAPWPKNDTIFLTKTANAKHIIIVEGILDALAIERAGYVGLALLGKSITSQQLAQFNSVNENEYLIYLDHDAFTHAIKLKLQLSALGIKSEIIQSHLDAAALAVKDMNLLRELIQHANANLSNKKS